MENEPNRCDGLLPHLARLLDDGYRHPLDQARTPARIKMSSVEEERRWELAIRQYQNLIEKPKRAQKKKRSIAAGWTR